MEGAIDWAGGETNTIKFQTNHQNSTLIELFQRFIKTPLLGCELREFLGLSERVICSVENRGLAIWNVFLL